MPGGIGEEDRSDPFYDYRFTQFKQALSAKRPVEYPAGNYSEYINRRVAYDLCLQQEFNLALKHD